MIFGRVVLKLLIAIHVDGVAIAHGSLYHVELRLLNTLW